MLRINLRQNAGRRSHAKSARAATRDYEHAASNTRLELDSKNQECLGDNRQSHAAKASQNQPSIISTLLAGQVRVKRASSVQPDDVALKAHAV